MLKSSFGSTVIKQDYVLFIQTHFEVDGGLVIGYQLQTRACLQLLIEANSFTSGHLIPLYFS